MGACIEQRAVSNHAQRGNPQSDLETVIGHFFRRAVTDFGNTTETFQPETAGETADGVRQSVDGLQGGFILLTTAHDALPDDLLDLMKVYGLPHE